MKITLVAATAGLWRKVGLQEQSTLKVAGWARCTAGREEAWGVAAPRACPWLHVLTPLLEDSVRNDIVPRNGSVMTTLGQILPLYLGVTS